MMAKKINEHQLTIQQATLSSVYTDLQDEILKQIIKRLKTADLSNLTSDNVLEWQIKKLSELNLLNRDTIDFITQQVGRSNKQLKSLLDNIGKLALSDTDVKLQRITGKPHQSTNHIDMMINAFLGQTQKQLNNYVNQTLISTNFNDTAQAQAYTDIVNNTVAKVATGMKSPEQALAETVYKWQDRGLESGLIDKGGHHWTAQGYANTVIQSTVPRIYGEVVKQRMDDYDYHLVLYPAHASSRPACAPLQGKVVNLLPKGAKGYDNRYPTVYDHGYGEHGGTLGTNCSHWHFTMFDPDTMTNNIDPVDPKQAVENYELTQQQRRLEANVRQSKSKLKAAEELGDKKGINKYKSDIRIKQGALRNLIDDHSEVLARDYRREKVYNSSKPAGKTLLKQRQTINPDKFARHVPGTHAFETKKAERLKHGLSAPSELTISQAEGQAIIKKYGSNGLTNSRDRFKADKVIGFYVDPKTGERIPTKCGTISYSKTGAHITPNKPRREE